MPKHAKQETAGRAGVVPTAADQPGGPIQQRQERSCDRCGAIHPCIYVDGQGWVWDQCLDERADWVPQVPPPEVAADDPVLQALLGAPAPSARLEAVYDQLDAAALADLAADVVAQGRQEAAMEELLPWLRAVKRVALENKP